jgi:TRAP-type mannitol/chloroaromatic compound transport system substrate-binding protein
MQSSFDPSNPEFGVAKRAVEAVNAMSEGRFVIDLLPGGAVVPSAEELNGLRTGALDADQVSYGYHKTSIPAANLFNSRAGGLSAVQYTFWYRVGGGNDLASEGLKPFGAMWLGFCVFPPEDWAYTTYPLNTLADIKGKLKMRTAGEGGEILTRMGASSVFMPGAEIYQALQRGVINAFEYGGSTSANDMGFHEVFKYMYLSLTRAPADTSGFECRIDKWEALPDDLKQILKRAIDSEAWGYYDNELVEAAKVRDQWRQKGIQIAPLPKEIEDAFIAEATKFYNEKLQTADDFYKKVLKSQIDFEKLLEENGVF